uniref:Uncharacterized protein n=1 Tax=Rhizophora mucronata TaxID=61149 RepID=A0A2P2P1F3_RHIMU
MYNSFALQKVSKRLKYTNTLENNEAIYVCYEAVKSGKVISLEFVRVHEYQHIVH